MEDSEIIRLLFQRDQQALTGLAGAYGSLCGGLALRILGDRRDAEECVNDVWLRVWNAIPPARPERLPAYLCRITRNLALDRLAGCRRQKRGGESAFLLCELSECLPARWDTEELADDSVARAIEDFLSGLDRRSRTLFLRRYFYAEPVSTLAEAFSMKASTVSTTLNRLRTRLRHYLEQEGIL